MEDTLQTIIDMLQKLDGIPAGALTVAVCISVGYVLRALKKFPNDAIPVVAILIGAVFYPLIADANNDWPLRTWIVRNAGIGLVYGLIAWLIHNQILSRIEDKLGSLLGFLKPISPPTETTTTPTKP